MIHWVFVTAAINYRSFAANYVALNEKSHAMKHLFYFVRVNERNFASQFTNLLTKLKNANETRETTLNEFLDAPLL